MFPLSLFGKLLLDAAVSWSRLFLALAASLLFSWAIGIVAARKKTGEKIILPLLDILQSIPILGFFPIVLLVFLNVFPLRVGVYLAVTFLIFTSMTWNIAFAVYEGVKAIPKAIMELASLERLGLFQKIRTLYIPATWPKVAYNSIVSWSAALFYLVGSEIFSLGNANYRVAHGIGVDIANYGAAGMWDEYATALAVLLAMLLVTYFLFLNEFSHWSERFKLDNDSPKEIRGGPMYKFYHKVKKAVEPKVRPIAASFVQLATRPGRNLKSLIARHRVEQTRTGTMTAVMPFVLVFSLAGILFSIGKLLPLEITGNLYSLVIKDEVQQVAPAFLASLARIWVVYFLSVAVGVPLGIGIALNRRLYFFFAPLLQIIAAIPAPALLPVVALAVLGLPNSGEFNAFFVILLGMIWYIVFNVVEGVRSIPGQFSSLASLLGLRSWSYWRNVLLPAILPSFITGSITALGGGWNALIIAEYFAVTTPSGSKIQLTQVTLGIGKLLDQAAANSDFLLLGLAVATLIVFIFGFNFLIWRRLYSFATRRSLLEGTR